MSRPFFAARAALVLLLLAAGPAAADPMFQYFWSVSPGTITTVSASDFTTPGSGTVTLASPVGPFTAVGGTDTVAATVKAVSTAPITNPDVIPLAFTGNYALTVSVTDLASKATGSLTFTGMLGGILTATGNSTTNTILGVTDDTGFTPGSGGQLTLGGITYEVDYTGYLAPGLLAEGSPGGIGFSIGANVPDGTPLPDGSPDAGDAARAPEPGSAVLALLGAGLAGLAGRRRRGGRGLSRCAAGGSSCSPALRPA
jgi:hypothetical protein